MTAMSHQVEIINNEIKSKKKKSQIDILTLQSTITERKNSLERLNDRLESAEKTINKLEEMSLIDYPV